MTDSKKRGKQLNTFGDAVPHKQSRRQKMVASQIQQILSMFILKSLKDPRIGPITITHVEISADFSLAKVFISMAAGEGEIQKSLKGLKSAGGFLKKKLASSLDMRKTPDLAFYEDKTLKKAYKLEKIFDELKKDNKNEDENS
ncbi:MAG: 30S ribosome-binding factor RbfA [Deltaproteobacteria bacterium]|nr:30S ribosome-binding factor RbfA [Deltaproteobacteria bacterium]